MSEIIRKEHNVSTLMYHIVCPAKYRRALRIFITNQNDRKCNADIQVKFAKDFVPAAAGWERQGFNAMCWFSLSPPAGIKASNRIV
jgi:hypothetical protein